MQTRRTLNAVKLQKRYSGATSILRVKSGAAFVNKSACEPGLMLELLLLRTFADKSSTWILSCHSSCAHSVCSATRPARATETSRLSVRSFALMDRIRYSAATVDAAPVPTYIRHVPAIDRRVTTKDLIFNVAYLLCFESHRSHSSTAETRSL